MHTLPLSFHTVDPASLLFYYLGALATKATQCGEDQLHMTSGMWWAVCCCSHACLGLGSKSILSSKACLPVICLTARSGLCQSLNHTSLLEGKWSRVWLNYTLFLSASPRVIAIYFAMLKSKLPSGHFSEAPFYEDLKLLFVSVSDIIHHGSVFTPYIIVHVCRDSGRWSDVII